jgi:hypothetical protein
MKHVIIWIVCVAVLAWIMTAPVPPRDPKKKPPAQPSLWPDDDEDED